MRAGGPFAAVIRFGTKAPVAHAVLYVGPQPDGTDVVEAQPAGVRRWYLNHWDGQYPGKRVPESPKQGDAIVQTALGLASRDTDYNFLADFYLGMREGLHIPVPGWLFRLASTAKHQECAQLVDYCWLVNGGQLFKDGRAPGDVSPADLWRLDYHKGDKPLL